MRYQNLPSGQIRERIAGMDWRARIDQCLCPIYHRICEGGDYGYGGVFFDPGELEETARSIAEVRRKSHIPPFLVADMEMGAGNILWGETEFPSMGAAGASGDPELSRLAGLSAASAGQRVGGLNWTLAPCADVCACPDSPMVSIRSAGADVDQVLTTVQAYVRGLQAGGCMATAKHFPGDGYSDFDQHLTTVVNPLSKEAWWRGPGRIYRELIEDGLFSVMPGHIALPAWDNADPETGLYPPATLSPVLLSDLLRNALQFEGLIVSDAINMGGMTGHMNYYDACEAFLNAGGDVLLFVIPDTRFYEEMEARLDRGSLSLERITESATRVMAMKEHLGLFASLPPALECIEKEDTERVAEEMAKRAIRIVRDRKRQLPMRIDAGARVLHVVMEQGPRPQSGFISQLTASLEARFETVEQWDDPGCDRLFSASRDGDFDLIFCSIMVLPDYGVGSIRLHGPLARNMMGGWMKFDVPVVFVSFGHPYLHDEYAASMDMVINTYGISPYCIDPLMHLVFDDPTQVQGKAI